MTILKISGIQKSFNDKHVIKDAKFDIKRDSRIGLVGINGAGKTTLMNILHGSLLPDSGTVDSFNKHIKIGYLKQSTEYTTNQLQHSLAMNEQEAIINAHRLGLSKNSMKSNAGLFHMSDGERLKFRLVEVWSSSPDLLILDEPTNHLDKKGIDWLVSELNKFAGAVVIISHDRHFLDQTVKEIIELEDGITKLFYGNYTSYQLEKQKLLQIQQHNFETQEKYKAKIQQQIANLKNWSGKAHAQSTKQDGYKEYYRVKAKKMDAQIKSKLKRLNNELEKNKVLPPKQTPEVSFQFAGGKKHGRRIIEAKNLAKWFNDHCLFKNSHFYMNHGERMGVIGRNGSGKSTFLRMLLGFEPVTDGLLWLSESLKVGYLSQDVSDLPEEKTPLNYLGLLNKRETGQERTILANIGLNEKKLSVPIHELSLGERTKIKLAKLLFEDIDLLILDEPTNHLDLSSREELEASLMEYKGSLLVVSHDVYFLNKISEKLLLIDDKQIVRKEFGSAYFYNEKPAENKKKDNQEQLMLLQNEIAALIGKLSFLEPNQPDYIEIDQKLALLLKEKQQLLLEK